MKLIRHVVLLATGVLVALLAASFVVLRWESANRLATSVSALAAVAGVGVAGWAALAARRAGNLARETGPATARRFGYATSGIDASANDPAPLEVSRTGATEGVDGGQAISGIRRRDR